MTLEQILHAAIAHQQAGRYAEADRLYRQVLAMDHSHPDAWHLLGTLAQVCGRLDLAVEFIGRAILLRPAPEYFLNQANALLQAKKVEEAVGALHRAIGMRPEFAEAFYLLGLALKGLDRVAEACDAMARAVTLRPAWAEARNGLGVLLKVKGDLKGAVECYREAVRLNPDFAAAWTNLGLTLKEGGQLTEAAAVFEKAAKLSPNSPDSWVNLGMVQFELGEILPAIGSYRRGIAINGNSAGAHNNLGIALAHLGLHEEAIAEFRAALALEPLLASAHSNLGNVLRERGKIDESISAHRMAVELDPGQANAHTYLGVAYKDRGDLARAMEAYHRALELNPNDADTYNNLGMALKDQGRIDEAIAAYRKAIELKPDLAEAYNNLGALKEQGNVDEAVKAIRRAVELDPKAAEIHSNLLFELNSHADYDQEKIFRETVAWGQQRADPLWVAEKVFANDRSPGRKLKIGYVSGDFTYHPVGRFVAPLIEKHDRSRFEVHCFSNVTRPDVATGWFAKTADRWHEIRPLSDTAVADLITSEQIDILVDLSLHTGGNRLMVFARKPAPVQAIHLAYCGTSGMKAMDYAISDDYLLPPEFEPYFTEKPMRLPDCYWCYRTLPNSPEVGPLPALSKGYVTFGCLNNFGKVSAAAFETWCELLKAVPGSRLLLHSKEGSHRQVVRDRMSRAGVDPQRLDFVAYVPLMEYLQQYHPIDIALDPFPFAGGTTTCDALWMGVPVVTLVGKTCVSRGGLSILTNAGLPELVTRSTGEYVKVAAELAADLPRLANLRGALRPRMQASPLMDEVKYVTDLEAAYRAMWVSWCGSGRSVAPQA